MHLLRIVPKTLLLLLAKFMQITGNLEPTSFPSCLFLPSPRMTEGGPGRLAMRGTVGFQGTSCPAGITGGRVGQAGQAGTWT